MPTGKANGSLLEDFHYDNDSDWFADKPTTSTSTTGKVMGVVPKDEDIYDDDDDDEVADLNDTPENKAKEKQEAIARKQKEDEGLSKLKGKVEDDKGKKADRKATKIEDEDEDEEVTQPKKNNSSKGKAKQDEDTNEEEEELEFFKSDVDQDEDPKPDTKKDQDRSAEEINYTALALNLVDRGTLNFELSEDDEVDEDSFLDMFEDEAQGRAEEIVEKMSKNLDDDGKRFLRHKINGGKTQDFLNVHTNSLDIDEFDEDDEKQVQKVLRHYITKVEGNTDEEEIQDRITGLKENGKQKIRAKKWFEIIKKKEEEAKDALIENTKKAAELNKNRKKAFADNIFTTLEKTDKVSSFTLSEADKKDLPAYMLKASVKLDSGEIITPFQVELSKILRAATPEDTKKLLLLGKLFKSNFNVKDLEKEVKTQVTKRARAIINKQKQTPSMTSSGGTGGAKSLADLIS